MRGSSWSAIAKSGFGKRVRKPSFEHRGSRRTRPPRPAARRGRACRARGSSRCASSAAAPTSEVMWTSWPQACITGTTSPASFFAVDLARVGQPGLLLDRQRVHVGAHEERGPLAVLHHRDDAEAADVVASPRSRAPAAGRRLSPTSSPRASRAPGCGAGPCRTRRGPDRASRSERARGNRTPLARGAGPPARGPRRCSAWREGSYTGGRWRRARGSARGRA